MAVLPPPAGPSLAAPARCCRRRWPARRPARGPAGRAAAPRPPAAPPRGCRCRCPSRRSRAPPAGPACAAGRSLPGAEGWGGDGGGCAGGHVCVGGRVCVCACEGRKELWGLVAGGLQSRPEQSCLVHMHLGVRRAHRVGQGGGVTDGKMPAAAHVADTCAWRNPLPPCCTTRRALLLPPPPPPPPCHGPPPPLPAPPLHA